MELMYETNPGTNYIASKMSETGLAKIKEAVAQEVTRTYTETMFEQIADAGSGMGEAADGAGALADGAKQLYDGNQTISENLQVLSDQYADAEIRYGNVEYGSGRTMSGALKVWRTVRYH